MSNQARSSAAVPCLILAGLSFPPYAAAQPRPEHSSNAQEPGEQEGEEIVVRADRQDAALIDRQTYVVRDTPLAQSKTAVEIIQDLPSVSRDASGQLRLLGDSNVKILIDGRDVPDADAMLNTLPASRIARVEIMTNPSAQFSAFGSAGIINIILRRSFADGLSGSAIVGVGNPDFFASTLSPTWSDGTWSVSASPSITRSDISTRRWLERVATDPQRGTLRTEDQKAHGSTKSASAIAQLSFQPTTSERYNLTGSIARTSGESDELALIYSPLDSPVQFREIRTGQSRLNSENISLERTARGKDGKEELKLSLSWSRYGVSTRSSFSDLIPGDARAFALALSIDHESLAMKGDYTVGVGRSDTLSIGAELQHDSERIRDRAEGRLPSGPVNIDAAFEGRWLDLSAYATLQTNIGSLSILPGLRIQRRQISFARASGIASTREALLYPSLHLERPFGKLMSSFSITRRADWTSIGDFRPYSRVTGSTTVDAGNPNLRPERTLSIEAGGRMPVARQQLSLTLYRRNRSGVRDTAIEEVGDGVLVSRPINVGKRLNQGGEFSIEGKLAPRVSYSASGWIAATRFDRLTGLTIEQRDGREYGGNGQVEYTEGKTGTAGFDHLVLNFRYQGPTEYLQSRTNSLWGIDLSYTHALTDRLSMVSSVKRLIGGKTVTTHQAGSTFLQRSSSEIYGPSFRVSLSYRLGK